jgi:hypothetical protein
LVLMRMLGQWTFLYNIFGVDEDAVISSLVRGSGGGGRSIVSVQNPFVPFYYMKFLPLAVPTKTNLAHKGMSTM